MHYPEASSKHHCLNCVVLTTVEFLGHGEEQCRPPIWSDVRAKKMPAQGQGSLNHT